MKSCGSRNVRKHRDIKNGEQYIVVYIYFNLNFLDNKDFTSSESKGYVVIPGKTLIASLDLRNKGPNKKQKARFFMTDITNQDFSKLLKNFKNSPYLGHNSKPTEAYLFLIKQIFDKIKSNSNVRLRNKGVKWGINKTIGHVNKNIYPRNRK